MGRVLGKQCVRELQGVLRIQSMVKKMHEGAVRRLAHTEYGKKDARKSGRAFSAYRVWQKRCVMKD